ncbi:hypothetical protein Q604_UNBc4C00079G0003, partial [human gut metagenome]
KEFVLDKIFDSPKVIGIERMDHVLALFLELLRLR